MPIQKAGENMTVSNGTKESEYKLVAQKGISTATFSLPKSALGSNIFIKDQIGKILVQTQFGKTETQTLLIPKSLLNVECSVKEGIISIKTLRSYKPVTAESLAKLAQSSSSQGKIFLMNSSHQDIAWMDFPENCVIERDTMLLTPLFEIGSRDPKYRFDVEDALMIKEYITRHPDKRPLVQQMLSNGNISCGSAYIQPYEEAHSGESLARQFYFGARWLKKEFNYEADTYWNVDVPGRTLQMPQVLHKSGVKNLMMSRQEKGLYHWYSPDGSYITAFSPGHYGDAYAQLNKTFFDAATFVAKDALQFNKYFDEDVKNKITPILSDWDMSAAKDYSKFIKQWESINQIEVENDKIIETKLPEFKIATAPEFFSALEAEKTTIPKIKGERPELWLYIHGPTHHKAITAGREADISLTMAEKFSTANALVKGDFSQYPYERLNHAWESRIYPDHGWGGKGGQITDDLFAEKLQFARSEANTVLQHSLNELASSVVTTTSKGTPIIVFNSLNWKRSGSVSVNANLETGTDVKVTDQLGKVCNMSITSTGKIDFFAEGVPACGYKTFYLAQKKSNEPIASKSNSSIQRAPVENKYYKISFGKGGLSGIFDKELNSEILLTDKFLGGEIFTMRSEGTGAGEFADIQLPTMEGFDKTSLHAGDWMMTESNAVCSKYSFRCPIRNAVIEETLIVYHNEKRIDFNVDLLNWDGELYREYRMAMPLKTNKDNVSYEVPFGVVNIGKDEVYGAPGERHKMLSKDVHPRGIQNWISASNDKIGATLSSSVGVADWIDPTTNPAQNAILQPLLLASRRSCHSEGNEYRQTGDHHFSFSFTSHTPGWKNGNKKAMEANEMMQVIVNPQMYKNASLPSELSFFSTDDDNLQISTVKKAEDSNGFVVRINELSGNDTKTKLRLFKPVSSGFKANLIEYKESEIKTNGKELDINIGHHSIETFLLK
jgi:alpha-mannosidase